MSKTALPQIIELPLGKLIKDFTLAGRSEKEIKDNAKELAPMLVNGWSPSQPGEVFKRDDKWHLAAGFTRAAAAEMNEHKNGYFVEVSDSATELRTTAIRTNASKPISAYEQGKIYAGMRDGSTPDETEVGAEILAPMKTADIAKEVGKTRQHVDNCIAVFENPPEIAELITSGQISAPVVVRAKQLVKDDEKKLVRFVKAIVKNAQKEGKESATMKDLDATRSDFAPLKAAVAKKSETPAPSAPSTQLPETPASATDAPKGSDTPKTPEKGEKQAPASESAPSGGDQPELFTPEKPAASAKKSAKPKLMAKR